MEYEVFIEKMQRLSSDTTDEQRRFYKSALASANSKSKVAFAAAFYMGVTYYNDGEFEKAREWLEPIVIDYQSYEYVHEIISGFNLLGIISHYEGEYILSRYYYNFALNIAKIHEDAYRYSYEYNNISLTYIAQKDFEHALASILMAKKYLNDSDADMGAFVYLNMSEIYFNLNKNEKALEAYNTGLEVYHGKDIIPMDYLNVGIVLFYKAHDLKNYELYKKRALSLLDKMHATEYIDCCKALFVCSMDANDKLLTIQILERLNAYLISHPKEIKLAMMIEDYKYQYAQSIHDNKGMLQALQNKNVYFNQIIDESQERRAQDLQTHFIVNQKLQHAMDSASKANQIKTQFLSNMSHDMRTPINGIMGMLQMIDKNRENDEKIDDCLLKIDASSKHLLSLVNDVLDMNKLELNTLQLEHVPFNLDQVCKQVDQIVADQALKEGIHVYQKHDGVMKMNLIGSATGLKKILINLFTNSVKYNKPNGSIYTSLTELSCTEKTVTYEFQIRDTGIGMSSDFIENRLYEPFVQETNVARSKYGGTGLGMSIVKGLVDQMHGQIEVESKLGKGTCFRVVLTFEIDLNPKQPIVDENAKKLLENKRVLLVEDNDLNMEVAQFFLQQLHMQVTCATNGQEACDIFKKDAFDFVLMDLMMPVMDGYEATKKIRLIDSNVVILAMSANAYTEDVKRCLEYGMNGHISKPIESDVLLSTLLKYIKRRG